MIDRRFHIGTGRYQSLVETRLMNYTYGPYSFASVIPEKAPKIHGTYGKLLFDRRWITRRAEIIARDNGCCVICLDSTRLQVHHRQYHYLVGLNQFKAPWDYVNDLMITLCERCHSAGHSKFRVPTIYI